jgi:hypothetical protein|tara:strand:+ start:2405 stop:2821 length:417 start_codon:yes stop_codon:yes gene_type:complete
MKKIALILFLSVYTFSLNAQGNTEEKKEGPIFKFEHETIDYGKIDKGSNGERVFLFTNVGTSPLIIENVKGSCGCTVPTKPDKPILPGDKGEIKVKYDTNRIGGFSKTVTIVSNAIEPRKIVRIKGLVEKPNATTVVQ